MRNPWPRASGCGTHCLGTRYESGAGRCPWTSAFGAAARSSGRMAASTAAGSATGGPVGPPPPALGHGQALARDDDHAAGDVARQRRGEPDEGGRHPARVERAGAGVVGVAEAHRLGHGRQCGRAQGVDGGAVPAELHGGGDRERGDGGLGRAVVRLARVAVEADRRHGVDGAGVDRRTGLRALAPVPGRPLGDEERALEVDPDHRVPVVLGKVHEHAVAGDPRVVHDHVEAPPHVERDAQQAVGARRRRDVADVPGRLAAGPPQHGDGVVDRSPVDVVDDDPAAGGGERLDVRPPDAACRAGDDADAPLAEAAHQGARRLRRRPQTACRR